MSPIAQTTVVQHQVPHLAAAASSTKMEFPPSSVAATSADTRNVTFGNNNNVMNESSLKRSAESSLSLSGTFSDGDGSSGSDNNANNTSSHTETQQQMDQQHHPKRPLMTHSKDGQQLSEKKLRRLEKNRLSARECRRRKREATENIQQRIDKMEAENLQLRLQLQIGEEAESCIALEQSKVTEDINSLLQTGASEADIYATLEEFKEKYADYGKSRRSSIDFHLRQIERLLMPTRTTSVVMHAIQGGAIGATASTADSTTAAAGIKTETSCSNIDNNMNVGASIKTGEAYASPVLSGVGTADTLMTTVISPSSTSGTSVQSLDSTIPIPAPPHQDNHNGLDGLALVTTTSSSVPNPLSRRLDPKALFRYLVQYLEVSPEQAAAMKDSRLVAQEMDGCLETALGVLSELRHRLAQTGEDLETEFYNVRSILTPTQAAKFLVWVANNDACMHMLNELWDRVYPQHHHHHNHHDGTVATNNNSYSASSSNSASERSSTAG